MGRRPREKLDTLDVNILVALATYGPRNLTKIARKLNTSTEMVRLRIKRMSSSFYLRLLTNIYHTNLGLKKAFVFAPATPGYEDMLLECMKVNQFYQYLSRCYGMFEGCVGNYLIPKGRENEFKQFILEIEKLGIAKNIQLFWTTCFHTVNPTGKWFDYQSETWVFPWDEWFEEIPTEGTELPYTLVDPEDFLMKADEMDLLIIPELEKDATVTLASIARKLGTSLERVKYHYEKHCIQRRIIEDFQIAVFPFGFQQAEMSFFMFRFSAREKMAKFAMSLLDKPYVFIVGKILGENAIIVQTYLPKSESRKFIDSLTRLIRSGLLRNYDYVIQDLRWSPKRTWSRMETPYKHFKDGFWIYDHEKYMTDLKNLVQQNIAHGK